MLFTCNNNKQIQALAFIGGLYEERKLFKPFILVQPQEYWAGLNHECSQARVWERHLKFLENKARKQRTQTWPLVKNGKDGAISF